MSTTSDCGVVTDHTHARYSDLLTTEFGARKMGQHLKALAALPEDQSSIPSTHMVAHLFVEGTLLTEPSLPLSFLSRCIYFM